MSAPLVERLAQIAQLHMAAPRGQKEAVIRQAMAELSMSRSQVFARIKKVRVAKPRLQRSDAGDSALTKAEAKLICAYVLAHIRKNGKRIKSIRAAVKDLRDNGAIRAGRVDESTGEILYMSMSSITRALWAYGLHPDQLLQPEPVTPLKSDYPMQVVEIDASLCVLFKLPSGRETRIEEINPAEYYKNKGGNWAKVEHQLVQRYLLTDHASGALFVHYALGGESARGLVEALIAMMVERKGYPMHGAPEVLMLDQASANRSALFRNLCKALGIRLHYTKPGNPRSKGQVEGGHNIWECGFESGLTLAPDINCCDRLNEAGQRWMHFFNGDEKHTRHGMTRYAAWQLVTNAQLRRVALTPDELRLLAREEPETRTVNPYLMVEYKGQEYDVSGVPDVMVDQKILVCRAALHDGCAQVLRTDAEGREVFHVIEPALREGPFKFFAAAANIAQGEYKRHADTPAQKAVKELELLAMQADTLKQAAEKRKAKVLPFGGAINPYKAAEEYQPPAWMPKAGTEIDTPRPAVAPTRLGLVDFIAALAAHMGKGWSPDFTPRVRAWHPDGGAESEIPALAERLARGDIPAERPALRAVK